MTSQQLIIEISRNNLIYPPPLSLSLNTRNIRYTACNAQPSPRPDFPSSQEKTMDEYIQHLSPAMSHDRFRAGRYNHGKTSEMRWRTMGNGSTPFSSSCIRFERLGWTGQDRARLIPPNPNKHLLRIESPLASISQLAQWDGRSQWMAVLILIPDSLYFFTPFLSSGVGNGKGGIGNAGYIPQR